MKKFFAFLIFFLTITLCITGGLFLPKFLLDRQQDSLFRKTETMVLPTMTETSSGRSFRKFKPEKLLQAAACYKSYNLDYWLTYTPEEEQMTAEEIFQVTHEQIDRLCQLNILPESFSEEIYTYEGFEHGIPYSPEDMDSGNLSDLDPDYSGWIILGGNNRLSITVYINSASGQILGLNASWFSSAPSYGSEIQILKQYLQYLELDQESVTYVQMPGFASCTFDEYAYSLNVSLENNFEEKEMTDENLSEEEKKDRLSIQNGLFISVSHTDSLSSADSNAVSP